MMIFEYLVLVQNAAPDVAQEAMGQMYQTSGQALWLTYKPLVAARWIHFASVFLLFGTSFFWFYMPREHSLSRPGQMEKALAATTVMLRIAAPVAAISGAAWMALVLMNMTSDIHSVFDLENWRLYFFETPVGLVSIIRLALFATSVVLAFLPWHGRVWYSALLPSRRSAFDQPSLAWPRRARRRWALWRNHDRRLRHPCARRGRLGWRTSAAPFRAR